VHEATHILQQSLPDFMHIAAQARHIFSQATQTSYAGANCFSHAAAQARHM